MPNTLNPFYKKLFIKQIIAETTDSSTFLLEGGSSSLQYEAGQFLTLVFLKSGKEERRSYSISSASLLREPLAITVKRVPNGEYSRKLIDTARVGDELITIGVSGFFTLPQDMQDKKEFVFFAAGSGITPVFSLIKTLLAIHPDKKILLIYSNRSPEDTIFSVALKQLATNSHHRFQIVFLFSNSPDIVNARLSNFRLEALLQEHAVKDLDSTLFYMCGPFDYMLMVNISLRAYGVPPAHIRQEHFSTFKTLPRSEPPDKKLHPVELRVGGKVYSFSVQYPVSILQKALQLNIDMPYSCEAGRCGTCVARCVEGKVWMSNNEVLLSEEISRGLVLTCTGYPVGGKVIIEV